MKRISKTECEEARQQFRDTLATMTDNDKFKFLLSVGFGQRAATEMVAEHNAKSGRR